MIIGASSFAGTLPELINTVDSIELYLPKIGLYEKGQLLTEEVEKLSDALSTQDINTSIHAPYFAETPNYPPELCIDTAHMNKHDFKLMQEAINLAEHFNSQVVVIHPGRIIKNREKSLKQMTRNLKQLTSYAQERGITLGLENKEGTDPENLCIQAKELIQVLDEVNSEHLSATFDIGHANLTCKGNQEALAVFAETLAGKIVHVHIHDNPGIKTTEYNGDHHNAIGTGCIDFNILRKLKYNKVYNLEMFSIKDVQESKKLLKHFLNKTNAQHYNIKSV